LPYRFTPYGALEILVVTSRQTRRWIIPKGWPIRGLKPGKSAAREAFEEAGIRGRISTKAVGAFTYEKALDEKDLEVTCEVRVFSLLVKRQASVWPEAKQRTSQWVDPAKAMTLVKEPELKAVIAAFARRAAAMMAKLNL
jgi:8-oxo-dGTP pyrophosphatase MutT (NUDIX family)